MSTNASLRPRICSDQAWSSEGFRPLTNSWLFQVKYYFAAFRISQFRIGIYDMELKFRLFRGFFIEFPQLKFEKRLNKRKRTAILSYAGSCGDVKFVHLLALFYVKQFG